MTTRSLPLLLLAIACAPPPPPAEPDYRGLLAEPEALAFVCVSPGCDTTVSVRVKAMGPRRIAVKRVILSSGSGPDFTIQSSQPAPFVLGVKSDFQVDVRYLPQGSPSPKAASLVVTYTDASPDESPDRLEPGEVVIPLVRRLVGEPSLSATPSSLSFGVVAPGQEQTLQSRIANGGFGNVAVEISKVDAGHPELKAQLPPGAALLPDAGVDLAVSWAPSAQAYLKASVLVTPSNPDVLPVSIAVEGTSLSDARVALEPSGDVDFGEVPKKQQRTLTRQLVNQGGKDLNILGITVDDPSGNLQASLPDGKATWVLPPLSRVPLTLLLEGNSAAELAATVTVASDDALTPALSLNVGGTVTEPKVQATPSALSFGAVPVGWVVSKPVELKNVGYGALTIKNLSMVAGSSSLFSIKQMPALPALLQKDQRIAVEVEFRAETAASFGGFLSVESDDPVASFAEVALTATAGSCADGCPIANGAPTCAKGVCEVGSCNLGWYDTDKSAATGCECEEIGTDPGSFCSDSTFKGTLKDTSKAQTNHTGVLASEGDVDVLRFFAEDGFNWFSDDFDVKVRVVSNDPAIKMCVYRYGTGSHQTDCYWTNEVCPSTLTYRQGGSLGGDSADFIVKVYREPGKAPTCTPYTVYMSNGI
ncbi:MAG: choice-of-anchor D domain-containing protein [Myxococcales bacterium]|nr:choice-of-anchor D domain-containing protein [Myxococcales bacterium]